MGGFDTWHFVGEIKLAFFISPFKSAGWEFPGGIEVKTHSFTAETPGLISSPLSLGTKMIPQT